MIRNAVFSRASRTACSRAENCRATVAAEETSADSKQTLLCTYLSAVLLVGLLVNAVFGWSWADPLAALVIAAVAVKEGRDAWRGEGCCATPSAVEPGAGQRESDACGCAPGCDCCP